MNFTEKDIPICKMIFNESTHEMGMLMYQERAKEIYRYICKNIFGDMDFFARRRGSAFQWLLDQEPIASFFFDNNLVDVECFDGLDIYWILKYSPIAEKIWNSGKLDLYLYKLNNVDITNILNTSPIADKIIQSGKLKLQAK